MKLKVCGITAIEQAQYLSTLPIDYLGFIGYKKSPRYAWDKLNPKTIASINNIQKVGVFVNENTDVMLDVAQKAQLDYVQLHGEETLETIHKMAQYINVIKAVAVGDNINQIQEQISAMAEDVTYFLFDTATAKYGGSGTSFNWNLLNNLNIPKPYFLSGGIGLETKIEDIQLKQSPFALDINSKFEISPGLKDVQKIEKFINRELT